MCGNFFDDFKLGTGRALGLDRRTLYSVTLFLVKMEEPKRPEEPRVVSNEITNQVENNQSISGFLSGVWNFFKGVVVKIFS